MPWLGEVLAIAALLLQFNGGLSFFLRTSNARFYHDSTRILSSRTTYLDPGRILPDVTYQRLENLIKDRGKARWEGDYQQADQLKQEILAVGLPQGLVLSIEDVPRAQGGGSKWKLSYESPEEEMSSKNPSVLQLAHAALGLAVSCSQTMAPSTHKQRRLEPLVQQAKETLLEWKLVQDILDAADPSTVRPLNLEITGGWKEVETALRGRKSADAAFWFALAGVIDQEIFDLLAQVCTKELQRFGKNPSCRAKHITQMMDRFAVAGTVTKSGLQLQQMAVECLQSKEVDEAIMDNQDSLLNLHSDRCLLMLWKFSARQKKQQSFLQSARKHWETNQDAELNEVIPVESPPISWDSCFEDTTRPLIIDIGCGMGISLLGLASSSGHPEKEEPSVWNGLNSINCNFLGVDLSGLAVGYANGVAHRSNLSGRLHFAVNSAENVLQQVCASYPGPVSLCMIQFPTPYRLPTARAGGNSQLPKSALEGFMVSPNLLRLVREALLKRSSSNEKTVCGSLLLQSNCEDVALCMHHAAEEAGFTGVMMKHPTTMEQMQALNNDMLPQRALNWIEMGGERAVGGQWSAVPLLPRHGSTETEVACRLNKTPIHRCLLAPTL